MPRDHDITIAVMRAAGDFAVFVGAIERGDFRLADDARRKLARRGYRIHVRPECQDEPALTIRYAPRTAPRREGSR